MLSTVLYYELAMKIPIPVGITVYLLTWGLGHLRCLVLLGSVSASIWQYLSKDTQEFAPNIGLVICHFVCVWMDCGSTQQAYNASLHMARLNHIASYFTASCHRSYRTYP